MSSNDIQEVITNPFLQIAAPMLAATIVLGIIIAKRKFIHVKSILPLICVAAITIVFACMGIKDIHPSTMTAVSEQPDNLNLYLANDLVLKGHMKAAQDVINSMANNQKNDAAFTLLLARAEVLKGNIQAADALYSRAKSGTSDSKFDFPEEEYNLVHAYIENLNKEQDDQAMIAYLKEQNMDPVALGYEETQPSETVSLDKLSGIIHDNMEATQELITSSDADCEAFTAIGKYSTDMEAMYEQYLSTNSYDRDEAIRIKGQLSSMMKEYPYLHSNKFYRLSNLKAMVLTGSYAELAKSADETCSTEELMILSELYMDGYINEKDFPKGYSTVETDKLQAVLDQCTKIYESDEIQNASASIKNSYKSNLNFLKQTIKHQNLVTTMNYLQSTMDSVDATQKSKAYLQLSKLNQYFGVEERAKDYLTTSMNTVGDGDDMAYVEPMTELVGIANGNGERNSLKNIAAYVDQVIDHSLPIELVEGIEPISLDEEEELQDEDQTEDTLPEIFDEFGEDIEEDPINIEDYTEEELADQEDVNALKFDQFVTDTISKKTATINIGFIDKSNFPKINAKIQVSSDAIQSVEDFKQNITLTDCHRKVDYTVEKQEYSKSRIILLVDVSGSMSSSMDSLRYAVNSFGNKLANNEEVRVIAFSDGISFDTGFLTNAADIEAAAESLNNGGGTALYTSLLQVGQNFTSDVNYNNVIICLTDGEDNDPASEADIRNEVSKMCGQYGCTVYTLGLGDSVDTNYLGTIADAGQGSFLYVDAAASIDNFFDFVHNQAENQYIVHYEAKDTITNKRILRADLTNESIYKEKIYYLVEPEYTDNEDEVDEDEVTQTQVKVDGLQAKVIYKSEVDVKDQLKGSNFVKDADVTVTLTGKISYNLPADFVDDSTYELTIPTGIAPGTYGLEIMINDEFFTLEDELSILVPGTEKSITFGDYTFTCLNSSVNDNGDRVLSGNVTLNGWLSFKGDVILSGDLENSDRITVTDNSGSYISYNSLKSKSGLAKFMAKKGVSIPLLAFGSFQIYKDEYDPSSYKDFPVEDVYNCNLVNMMFLMIENPKVSIYPDMLYVKNFTVNFDMPFQEALLGEEFNKDLQSTEYEIGFMLTATSIGLKTNIEYSMPEEKEARMSTLPLSLKEAKLDVDTFANNYDILVKVAFKSLPSMDAIGGSFSVVDGRFDGLGLYAETGKPITLQAAPVPITMNDFGINLSGLSSQEKLDLSYILGLKLSAQFDVNVADVEAVLPAVASFLDYEDGDAPCVVQFDDCTFDMTLKDLEFAFTSNLKFLGMYDFGSVEANLGKFKYSNKLLNLRSITEYGLRAKLTLGHKWETSNCMLDLKGSLELVTGYPYFGIHGSADGDFEVSWFVLKKDFDISGDLLIGFVQDAYGDLQFNAILRGGEYGNYSGFHAYASPTSKFKVDVY